jgi:hypothetical protein
MKVQMPIRNIAKERIATASEVAALIAAKGWRSAEVIAGTKSMLRLLWIELRRYGIDLKGYEQDADDERCYDRLMKHVKSSGQPWEKKVSEELINDLVISGAEGK